MSVTRGLVLRSLTLEGAREAASKNICFQPASSCNMHPAKRSLKEGLSHSPTHFFTLTMAMAKIFFCTPSCRLCPAASPPSHNFVRDRNFTNLQLLTHHNKYEALRSSSISFFISCSRVICATNQSLSDKHSFIYSRAACRDER